MSCMLISAMFPHIAGRRKNALRTDVGLETDGYYRGLFLFDLTLSGAARRSIISKNGKIGLWVDVSENIFGVKCKPKLIFESDISGV